MMRMFCQHISRGAARGARRSLTAVLSLCVFGSAAAASTIPLTPAAIASGGRTFTAQGHEFSVIGRINNSTWPGNGQGNNPDWAERDYAIGRGRVAYEYGLSRLEVTSAQWVAFFNAAYDRPSNDRLPHLIPPDFWGGIATTPTVPGGRRWRTTPQSGMRPSGDISWRMAAMYCNWLHNDKRTDRAAFLSGAYDVSTFSYRGFSSIFNDQLTRSPGARFWIPSWDEWLKGAHYDPNKFGPGQEGWWSFPTTSDIQPQYGPPGRVYNGRVTQSNAGWDHITVPGADPFSVPLGAYPTVQSPWGLLDVSGGTSEWTEETNFLRTDRIADGSAWAQFGYNIIDQPYGTSGEFPSFAAFDFGFRIAAAVPGPTTSGVFMILAFAAAKRTKQRRS